MSRLIRENRMRGRCRLVFADATMTILSIRSLPLCPCVARRRAPLIGGTCHYGEGRQRLVHLSVAELGREAGVWATARAEVLNPVFYYCYGDHRDLHSFPALAL